MEEEYRSLPLIGDKAPEFKAVTTQGEINFPSDYKGKWVVLFSHPADFTPVCTTEFMTFAHGAETLRKLNTELVGLSVDGLTSHIAWLRKIQELEWKDMKNIEVKFPLIEDIKMDVAKKYGMIQPKSSDTKAVRAMFFIDPNEIIRCIHYPLSTEELREMVRVIKARKRIPTRWQPLPTGCRAMTSPPLRYLRRRKGEDGGQEQDMYCLDWFLCFNKEKKN